MVEKGRHLGISSEIRKCVLCEDQENAYHFLPIRPLYDVIRMQYLPDKYYIKPTINKFNELLASKNCYVIRKLAMFIWPGYLAPDHSSNTIFFGVGSLPIAVSTKQRILG